MYQELCYTSMYLDKIYVLVEIFMVGRREHYTDIAQSVITRSQELARELRHTQWSDLHVLTALLQQADGISMSVITELKLDISKLKSLVERRLLTSHVSGYVGDQIYITPGVKSLLQDAAVGNVPIGPGLVGFAWYLSISKGNFLPGFSDLHLKSAPAQNALSPDPDKIHTQASLSFWK